VYLEGWDGADCSSRTASANKFMRLCLNRKSWAW
jgi:hypothetical protein